MSNWDIDTVAKMLDEFLGAGDPDDPKERKRLRILQAATELFIKHGYRRTSVDEVARNAGVAKGTVYLYFKTKADLLLHAIGEEKKHYFGQLRPIFSPDVEPRDRLRRWIKTALVLGTEMPLISRLMSGDREILAVLDDIDADVNAEWEQIRFDFIGQMIDEAAGPHTWTKMELRDRAAVIYGLAYFSGLIAEERIRSGLSIERYADILANMIVDGISVSKRMDGPSKRRGGKR